MTIDAVNSGCWVLLIAWWLWALFVYVKRGLKVWGERRAAPVEESR